MGIVDVFWLWHYILERDSRSGRSLTLDVSFGEGWIVEAILIEDISWDGRFGGLLSYRTYSPIKKPENRWIVGDLYDLAYTARMLYGEYTQNKY